MSSLDTVSKHITSSFLGWCNADPAQFRSLTDRSQAHICDDLASIRAYLLAKQLLNNLIVLAFEKPKKFLKSKYVDTCTSLALGMHEFTLACDTDEDELERLTDKVLTILSGRALLYTPLDFFLAVRSRHSFSSAESFQVTTLMLSLSSHPSFYKLRADELAIGIVYYNRIGRSLPLDGFVLEKKHFRFIFSDYAAVVEVVHGMALELGVAAPEWRLGVRYLGPATALHPKLVACHRPIHLGDNSRALGVGIRGEVVRAHLDGSPVAVKVQKKDMHSVRELAVMCSLSHSNVQSARSFSFSDSQLLIHMPVQSSLYDLIYQDHTQEEGEEAHHSVWTDGYESPFKVIDLITRRNYARQLLRGLVYLSDLGILHGDIKPSNLLISHSGVLKISDYGLSVVYSLDLIYTPKRQHSLYAPAYRDPHIKHSKADTETSAGVEEDTDCSVSFEADIWAAGITLLEMETGILPNLRRKDEVSMQCIRDKQFERVCAQMLAIDRFTRVTARQALLAFE